MKKLMMTGLTAVLLSSSAIAGEVTGYTAPVTGQPATATGVDSNFQALINAINDNNTRITALESFDVAGKTYTYKEIGILNAAERLNQAEGTPGDTTFIPGGFARTGVFTASGTLVFNAGNTFDLSLTEREIEMFVNTVTDIGPTIDGTISDAGSWSQSGPVVTLNFNNGDSIQLNVSKGATAFTLVNQGIGGLLIDEGSGLPDCRPETVDIDGDNVADGNPCIHEYQSNLGIGLLAE